MNQRQKDQLVVLAIVLGLVIVIAGGILFHNWVVGPESAHDDPATASCRTAYQHGGARAYHLTENAYIDKCVQGIRDLQEQQGQ